MATFREQLRQELQGPSLPLLWAAMTVLMAMSGPLGTHENCTLAHRTLFWAMTVGAIILLTAGLRALLHGRFGAWQMRRDLPLVAAAVALLLIAPFSALAQGQIVHDGPILTSTLPESLVFLFLTAMGIGAYSFASRPDPSAQPSARAPADPSADPSAELAADMVPAQGSAPSPAPLPRLVQRLDPGLRGDLVSITGRDHYVDIRTTAGSATLLMRFSDAVAEAAPTPGAQVHRSHWVAWSAVTGRIRDEDRLFVLLQGGGRVPVSRSYRHVLDGRDPAPVMAGD